MKRRSFLGLFGGGVLAGPSLAKDMAGEAIAQQAVTTRGAAGLVGGLGGDYTKSRIKELRRLLAGEESEEEKEERRISLKYALEQAECFRLDALRSVSPQHKSRMLLRHKQERETMRQISWWRQELNRLLQSA